MVVAVGHAVELAEYTGAGGRASFTMKFSSYELVPADIQDKLLKEYAESQADD
jgi:translation elongation factor EF-G